MKSMKPMLPFLAVMIVNFYLLPLAIRNTGLAMLVMLAVIPFICLACSFFYGLKGSFSFAYPVAVAVLFAPSIFIFYNSSAWVYIIAYGVIALIGGVIGKFAARQFK